MREAFFGTRRFDEFQQRLAISTNILAQRLDRLVGLGVLTRVPYQQLPVRHEYRLSDKGLDLYPVPLAMLTTPQRAHPPRALAATNPAPLLTMSPSELAIASPVYPWAMVFVR